MSNITSNTKGYYDHCDIYLDNAATTQIDSEAMKDIVYALEIYYNPSSAHRYGMEAKRIIERARDNVRRFLGADRKSQIIFTSSGTEANNLAIQGFFNNHMDATDFLCPPTEHPSIRKIADYYEEENLFRVHWLRNDYAKGCLDLDNLEVMLDEIRQTWNKSSGEMLVSCMMANNETGTLNDIQKITEICHSKCNVFIHTDLTQAIGHVEPINIRKLGVDMASFSGHKLGLPKGIGVLYVKDGVNIGSLMFGGNQEDGLRPGTENLPYIYALGNRVEEIKRLDSYGKYYHDEGMSIFPRDKEKTIRDYFEYALLRDEEILKLCPQIRINYKGEEFNRLPNISSVTFAGFDARKIQTGLGERGICVSVGSACSNYRNKPSRTLLNLGFSASEADSTVRFSFNDQVRLGQIDMVIKELGVLLKFLCDHINDNNMVFL